MSGADTRMTESQLIDACLREERLAQKQLYDRYKDAMYTVAYRITGDFDLANDALQDGFINIFRGLPKFRRESTLGAWIKKIIVRAALKRIRNLKPIETLNEEHTGGLIDWGDHLQAEYLEKAIMALPDGYRSVFVMIEVEGYSHKEVAENLDISVGTSKSQLFYAKKKLRASLEKYR